jgi:hypothetical protein
MVTGSSRWQPSGEVGVGGEPASSLRAPVARLLAGVALLCVVLAGVLHQGLDSGARPAVSLGRAQVAPREGLSSLPFAARGVVSAALGRDQAAYRLEGLAARNPAQGFSMRFGRSGVAITSSSARFELSLTALGRGGELTAQPRIAPVASVGGVSYSRAGLREWWANGPSGLEQGFDVATRPAGSGALTLALAVPASARMDDGMVLLPGGLRYAGVHATDAAGRVLPAWLELRGGLVLLRVADRGARYPLRIDPFVERAELTAKDAASHAELGYSVAIYGSTAVVGAPDHAVGSSKDQGAVYVFEMKSKGWASATQTAELTNSAGEAGVELGYSVAISGDTIVAGAPAGSELPHDSNPLADQGTVDVFTTPTGKWKKTSTPTAQLTDSAAQQSNGGELGWSVAISGSTIVAGAPYDGEGKYDGPGEAFVYTTTGAWTSTSTPSADLLVKEPSDDNELFGTSVGVSERTVIVGAPAFAPGGHGQGAAYVFTEPAGGWSGTQSQTATLLASDPTGNPQLGISVGVSGKTVVAGAYNQEVGSHDSQGAAYVFVMPTGGWKDADQNAELTASGGQEDEELGYSVAISGAAVVAGARQHQVASNGVNQGAAYTFIEPAGGWAGSQTSSQELTAANGATSDNFGDSIAISANTIVVGVPRNQASAPDPEEGAAYIFEAPLPTITKLAPEKGTTAGGTQVIITGTNFTGVTAVRFGAVEGTIISSSSTSITVETPPEAGGTVEVSVTTPDGTTAPSSKDDFKFQAPKGPREGTDAQS